MQLCFFEDEQFKRFHPLTLTRPVDDLRLGILTLAEKWTYALGTSSFSRLLRPGLRGVFPSKTPGVEEVCLWINARYLPVEALLKEVRSLSTGNCLKYNNTVIAAKVEGSSSRQWLENNQTNFNSLFVIEATDFPSVQNIWDLFQMNAAEIVRDIKLIEALRQADSAVVSPHAVLQNKEHIFIEDSASVEANAILDARQGPVYIGKNATVMAAAIIKGPVAVCEGAVIKPGAIIYDGSTIGPVCKAAGEISNTIFHSYSNKAHDGYIGNSVIGQWCNFGAGTTVSNLKNNYSPIRISDWLSGEPVDTGLQFFGVVMGDHTKTAINSVLNSGTLAGVSCNILSRNFPPKLIPSFSWVGSTVIQPYKLDKALETMETMMARRNVSLDEAYKRMMETLFKNSNHG